jgi:hypothetical protein
MPSEFLTLIKTGFNVAKAVREFRPGPDAHDRRLQDDVTRALRTLYFTPDGILSLLKEIVAGRTPSEQRIQHALNDFNDREWNVEAALQRIDFQELRKELGLSLASLSVLDQLRYGKINVRRAVQSEVNFYGQDTSAPNRAKARKLIAAIEKLNAEIEDIEGIVNARARSGPARKPHATKKRVRKRIPHRRQDHEAMG